MEIVGGFLFASSVTLTDEGSGMSQWELRTEPVGAAGIPKWNNSLIFAKSPVLCNLFPGQDSDLHV